jgi:hypothetical protein
MAKRKKDKMTRLFKIITSYLMFYDVKIMECKKIKPPKEIQETTAIVFLRKTVILSV